MNTTINNITSLSSTNKIIGSRIVQILRRINRTCVCILDGDLFTAEPGCEFPDPNNVNVRSVYHFYTNDGETLSIARVD